VQDVLFLCTYCINPALNVSMCPCLFSFFQNLLELGSTTANDKHVVILNDLDMQTNNQQLFACYTMLFMF